MSAVDGPPDGGYSEMRDGREKTLATLFLASFWVLPLVGPVILRILGRPRTFAMHYFRYALITQGAFVFAYGLGGLELLLAGRVEWASLVVLPVLAWALYASIAGLLAVARGERRRLWPVPSRWLWARWER